MTTPPDPLAFASALPATDRTPTRSASWAVAHAERAYDAVLEAYIREALAKHPRDRVAAARYLGMAQQAFARAATRYGIETEPGKAGRPPKGATPSKPAPKRKR